MLLSPHPVFRFPPPEPSPSQISAVMLPVAPYSLDLMTRLISDFAPTWDEVYDQLPTPTHSSPILSEMVNRYAKSSISVASQPPLNSH